MIVKNRLLLLLVSSLLLQSCNKVRYSEILLRDNFTQLDTGLFSAPVGAHTEYHYLPEAGTKGNWVVSSFASGDAWGRAWQVVQTVNGKEMSQTFLNKSGSTHPMVIAGDSLWKDYRLKVRFIPENNQRSSGIAFRYRNDRCFYFFGVRNSRVYISLFDHSDSFNSLTEKILAEKPFEHKGDKYIMAEVTVTGDLIIAKLNDSITLSVSDNTFSRGKIGLVSNSPARYSDVEVMTSRREKKIFEDKKAYYEKEAADLQADNPGMVVWKKMSTRGFGVGRNLRFGDLDGDRQIDVLIGQVVHHGPRDSHSELSCLTAMTFNGDILWQAGKPDPEKNHLTNDVGFQIIDLDNDGTNEVVYCMNSEIIVAEASSGKTLYKAPTPRSRIKDDTVERILGDCLFFFDAEGKGYDCDILIKDRYNNFWVMDSDLKPLWEGSCKTGHYPFAYDTDNDGKDEVAIGYSLYDHNGQLLWCLDDKVQDHADGVAIVDFDEDPATEPVVMYTASNDGYLRVDLKGNIIEHFNIGHVQNPAVANFRSDMAGLETVSINFWGNQGIIHLYDEGGLIYHDFEPYQFGSMCLPLNWKGEGEEYFVLNPNVEEGGVFDGLGRKVLQFPDDNHPDMCNSVLDITGDSRDEIVVWNPDELWVYTQSDNPRSGKLYKPVRNPLYNYSNYQATVSLPGWTGN